MRRSLINRQSPISVAARTTVERLEDRKYFAISYLSEGPIVTTGDQPVSVIAADFNGDGKMDVATGDYTSKTVTAFLNDGAGNFTLSQTVQLTADIYDMAAVDMTGDGKTDLVVREFNGNNFRMLPGNGDGTFGAVQTLSGSGGSKSFDIGDIDGDGDLDIVTGRSSGGQDGLWVFRNKGTGAFEFEAGQHFDGIGQVNHVHLADVNGDGKLDALTVGTSLEAPAGLFLNDGNGGFGTHTGLTTTYTSTKSGVRAADMNNDGKQDFVVFYQSGGTDILLGDGSGGFAAPANEFGFGDADLAIVDMNLDGKLDMVTGNYTYGAVAVNPGNGNGTIGAVQKEYLFGSNVSDFAVADFNGDNKPDVVVVDGPDDELILVLNSASGSSNPSSPPPAPPPATPGNFDLTASVQGSLPASVIGGQTKGKASVIVTNAGSDTHSGDVTVALYASTDGAWDGGDTLLGTIGKKLKLTAGKARSLAMKFVFPSVADGSYQILAKVESAGEVNTANNTAAAASPVTIAGAFADLSPTIARASQKKGKLKASLMLTNLGNTAAGGLADIALSLVPQAGGASISLPAFQKSVNVKPGAARKVGLTVALPVGLAAGDYKLQATVSGGGDTIAGNNLAESAVLNIV